MTTRDMVYASRDDDEELHDMLSVLVDQHKVFENCEFKKVKTKTFNNCKFIGCSFEDVAESTFNNCVFETCKFYEIFKGTMYNCNIIGVYGKLIERRAL